MSDRPVHRVIVVGGGLAGLSAAHTVLENGGVVTLIEKLKFMGGNSTKATSGINAALTTAQIKHDVKDSVECFLEDTIKSSKVGHTYPLAEVLVGESAPSVEWLIKRFGLDLSLVSRLGGHTYPRTHRGKEQFPGMTITTALMYKFEDICKDEPHRAKYISRARANELIVENGEVVGVKYLQNGEIKEEYGSVILATGGYAADYEEDSLLKKYRPDILKFPTTNGTHATGDGIKMAMAIGGDLKDIDKVQVHPTGLVNLSDPDNKIKFLAAEALRGVGGIMLDKDGKRFVNELQTRDYVSGEMMRHDNAPYYLILNGKASSEIHWHCEHYCGRKVMKHVKGIEELAKEMKADVNTIKKTFEEHNTSEKAKKDPFGKIYFQNGPWIPNDEFYMAVITPVAHYCMGGVKVTGDSEVESGNNVIPGLFAAGEIMGGTHGANRLGGSSLLDCVVFGRVAGRSATRYQLNKFVKQVESGKLVSSTGASTPVATSAAPVAEVAASGSKKLRVISEAEVAKHNTEDSCWIIVNGRVLDCTEFMHEHPGGANAVKLFAGKDATAEFLMMHGEEVIERYAPEIVIGVIETKAKL